MSGERFPGFPDRITYLPVPACFFGALLRDIDDFAELKLTLHCWRLLQQQKGNLRYVRRSQLEADRGLLLALRSTGPEAPGQIVAKALEAACGRGTLLCLAVQSDGRDEACYFLNTAANQQIVQNIRVGDISLGLLKPLPPAGLPPALPRPGIFELYEQNIGLLTPLIVEELRDAEAHFPDDWIEDAFREAVAYNRRNWRYIRRILDNWATRGRGERGENRGYPQPPRDAAKYLRGRDRRLIER